FNPVAAQGGFAGAAVWAAIRFGVARGVFSNEAGLGSAPIAHAAAKTQNPIRQGLIAMLGTFIDTIIVCSVT
ncbi:alanine:cation symporter family protein, partial [Vibrio parahaemolyticus]